jgi:hypothetical protein
VHILPRYRFVYYMYVCGSGVSLCALSFFSIHAEVGGYRGAIIYNYFLRPGGGSRLFIFHRIYLWHESEGEGTMGEARGSEREGALGRREKCVGLLLSLTPLYVIKTIPC